MNDSISFRQKAAAALFWSTLQNWGGRIAGLVVFVLLARLLNPADFGLASSAFLVMTFLNMIAEFGCSDALVQRKNLQPQDVNLPFFASMTISISLAVLLIAAADRVSDWMGVAHLAPYLRGTAVITPLMTLLSFQEILYRRAVLFRRLAMRTILGTVVGGIVGIGTALMGWGTWALITQFGAQTLVGVVWLWSVPIWTPTLSFRYQSAREMAAFGSKVLAMFVVDFMIQKSVDLIILLVYGPTSLGFFTVASRVYLLLLQLLQTSISSVGLTMLARIVDDMPRIRRLYVRSTSICATFGSPIFFGLAALAPEVNRIMFGIKWIGADRVMVPMLLIGGIHCVQFINSSYLTVIGRPQTLLRLTLTKAAIVLPPLYFIRVENVAATANLYALSLLLLTPLDFIATFRALQFDWRKLIKPVGMPLISCCMAFSLTSLARNYLDLPEQVILRSLILGSCFAGSYIGVLTVFAWSVARENIMFAYALVKR